MRATLVAVLVGLLTLSCTALTVITAVGLHSYLVDRLDQQLAAAGNRYALTLEHPSDRDGDNPTFDTVVGQQAGTLGARSLNGAVTASGITGASAGSLSAADLAVLATLAVGGPRDVHLPGVGEYRILVTSGRDSDRLITGLPKHPVDDIIARLLLIEVLVFGAAMLLTGLAGTVCVRWSLRPLDRVARTARTVSALSLGSGDVQLPDRLPALALETEIGQVTEAFNQMLARVASAFAQRQRSEQLLRQFVADASHELRTPVAVIRSHAELAQLATEHPEFSAEALGTALARITSESIRMGGLVDDLLLLARLDSGRELAHEDVDLTRIVLDAVLDARALGPEHRWQLDLPEQELAVSGDAHSLQQVVVNLLANAREHTPSGTTVRAVLRQEEDQIRLVVCDDGPGIDAEFLPRIFQRFARADSARIHRGGESGLGLSIVEAIVRAHNATITVTSRPGQTRFEVLLPAAHVLA